MVFQAGMSSGLWREDRLQDLTLTHGYLVSHRDILVSSKLQLTGPNSILDRTLVIRSAESGRTVCASIRSTGKSIYYRAKLRNPVAGQVLVKQNEFGTVVFTHLFDVAGIHRALFHQWAIVLNLESDTPETVHHHQSTHCQHLQVNGVLNLTHNLDFVPIGDDPSSLASRMFYYTPKLPNLRVITGALYIVLYSNGRQPMACAKLLPLKPREVVAKFTGAVRGEIRFQQDSFLDSTTVTIELNDLKQNAYSFGIDELPVISRGFESSICPNAKHTIYNPTQISPDWVPKPGKGTYDQFAVGDLSGKYGTLQNRKSYFFQTQDPKLMLFGEHSIVGRALIIYTPEGKALDCGNVESEKIVTALATFMEPIQGQIILTQDRDDPDSETTIYAELSHVPNSPLTKTYNHEWAVHESQVFSGQSYSTTECTSAGPRYNPFNVSGLDYSCRCSSKHTDRCAIGDLTKKDGALDIPIFKITKGEPEMARYIFTDSNLPISGPLGIIGKSVVIFGEEKSAKPLVCANIGELNRRNEL